MKRVLLILALLSFSMLVFAADCEIALPRYGRIQCDETGDTVTELFNVNHTTRDGHPISIFEHTCVSDCYFDATSHYADVILKCPFPCGVAWSILKNGDEPVAKSSRVEYNVGDTIRIEAYCCNWYISQPLNKEESKVIAHFDQIMLREAWAGSLPDLWLSGTEKCILNEQVDKYRSNLTDIGNYIDPTTGDSPESRPTSTYSNLDEIQGNMRVTENYVFIKDWQTGIAGISLTYDKSNKAYWCGGTSGRRKIYQVNEIEFQGSCYAIPQSIALDGVECCIPSDCTYKGAEYTCNPDNWKCEETRWCNSDLECQQTFSSGVCENRGTSNVMVSWGCDRSKPWSDYAGTCIKSERTVQQCPRDCTSEEYYNEEQGICKPIIVLIDCPYGKCCKEGGDYKSQECESGLECCMETGTIVGKCETSCAPPPIAPEATGLISLPVGGEGSYPPTAPNMLLPIIILIMLAGAGFAVYYFYYMKPKQAPVIQQGPPTTGQVCSKCGSPLKTDAKFCSSCGNKITKKEV